MAFDTGMSAIDGVFEIKGSDQTLLFYYGSRYNQFTTMGVGRHVMLPWDVDPKDKRESLTWAQTWWLDAAKGTWAKRQPADIKPTNGEKP